MSEGAVRVAVHRIRKSYGRKIREIVAATVTDPEEAREELQHLLSVLGE